MLSGQVLLAALAEESPDAARSRRRQRFFAVLSLIIGLAGVGAALWLVAQAALYAWATTNWDNFDLMPTLPNAFLYICLYALLFIIFSPKWAQISPRALHYAVTQGDERVVAAAAFQPLPLSEAEIANGIIEFRAIRCLPTTRETQARMLPFLLLAIIPFQIINPLMNLPRALGMENLENWLVSEPISFVTLFVPGLLFLVGMAMYVGGVFGGPRKRWEITANAVGLTWRRRERGYPSHAAPWGAIRSFFKATYRDPSSGERTAFIMGTDDELIGWVLGQRSKDIEFAESERLSRLIVTRTGQPLRELASSLTSPMRWRSGLSAQPAGLPDTIATRLASVKKRLLRRMFVLLPFALAIAVALFAEFSAKGWLQSAQHSYFAGLVPQVHASRQLFHDTLSYDDGLWPVTTPTATRAVGQSFTSGGYRMTGDVGQSLTASTSAVYGDAAVEVTARDMDASGIGLVLRARSTADRLVFQIHPTDGSWTLAHDAPDPTSGIPTENDYGDGTSGAIHTGYDTTNTLLVVMRGGAFLLYANGQLLDVVTNMYDDTMPTQGQVGLYLDDGVAVGTFTNFTVYAVQPASSAAWV